jgi:hypothetical protein
MKIEEEGKKEDEDEEQSLTEEQKQSLNRILGKLMEPNLKAQVRNLTQSLPSLVLEQEQKRLEQMFSLQGVFYFHGKVYKVRKT